MTTPSKVPQKLVLGWPTSVNRYWRHWRGRMVISAAGRAYRQSAPKQPRQIAGRVACRILACPPDKRARDLDNALKAILDALTACGVWRDDSQIDDLRIVRGPVVPGGRIEVEIEEIA